MQAKLQRSVERLEDEVSQFATSQETLKQSIDVLQTVAEGRAWGNSEDGMLRQILLS